MNYSNMYNIKLLFLLKIKPPKRLCFESRDFYNDGPNFFKCNDLMVNGTLLTTFAFPESSNLRALAGLQGIIGLPFLLSTYANKQHTSFESCVLLYLRHTANSSSSRPDNLASQRG